MALVVWGKGKHLVDQRAARQLNLIDDQVVKDLLWNTMSQGKGTAKASGTTHLLGLALDFVFWRSAQWTNAMLHRVCAALQKVGFAVAPRYAGELGKGNPAHLHAALRPFSNSFAIDRAQRIGTPLKARINRAIPLKAAA